MKLYKFLPIILLVIVSCTKGEVKEHEHDHHEDKNELKVVEINSNSSMLKDIKSEFPQEKYIEEEIKTTGIIKNYENSISNIVSPVSGMVNYENIEIGKFVKAGTVIAKIQNNEIIKIFSNYIHEFHSNELLINQAKLKLELAKENFKREEKLYKEGISAKKDFIQAENEYLLLKEEVNGLTEHNTHIKNEAKALLKIYNVDLPEDNSEYIKSYIEIKANKSGIFTKKNILQGSNISTNDSICEITDNTNLYAQLNILSSDINKIHLNDTVEIYNSSEKIESKIEYIEPSINKEEQVFIARVPLNNNSNNLKSNLFINASIKIKPSDKKYLFLDNKCITNMDNSYFVFVDKGNNSFEKKELNIKEHTNTGYFIESGIDKNEKVVCDGNFHLKSEILKSTLEDDH